MNKLTSIPIVIVIIFASLLTSCKKEPPLSEAIIGRWEVQSYKYITYVDNVKKSELTFFMESKEMEIQFAEGGAGLLYQNEQLSGNFGWSLSGSTLSAEFANETQAWEITVDGDTLTWTYTETEVTGNVTSKYQYVYTAIRVK